ncbi:TPA: hypothetical protein MDG23_003940 [Escherichia coli]|nr:hypothetical protein [Escherichia coli]
MNTLAALENTFRDMRKHGCQTVMVTQSLADFGRYSYKRGLGSNGTVNAVKQSI